jgi:hypothetical protein
MVLVRPSATEQDDSIGEKGRDLAGRSTQSGRFLSQGQFDGFYPIDPNFIF